MISLFFFFFQAEDGIRDWSVTGVQTCALPISFDSNTPSTDRSSRKTAPGGVHSSCDSWAASREPPGISPSCRSTERGRSEERRVGKECRCRGEGSEAKRKERREVSVTVDGVTV